jgi:C1A family cysteine protease
MATAITPEIDAEIAVEEAAIETKIYREPVEHGTGWLRDWPDARDFTAEHEEIRPQLEKLGIAEPEEVPELPVTVDLRPYFSPIENQLNLGSCTANAAAGVVEYYERRASIGTSTPRGFSSTR